MANKKVYTIEGRLDTQQIVGSFKNMVKNLNGSVDSKALNRLSNMIDSLELAAEKYNRILSEGITDTNGLRRAEREIQSFYGKIQNTLGKVKQVASDPTLAILSDTQINAFNRRKTELKKQIDSLNKIIQDSSLRFTKAFNGLNFSNGSTKINFDIDTQMQQELSRALSSGNTADFEKALRKLGQRASETLSSEITSGFSDGMKKNTKTLASLSQKLSKQAKNIDEVWGSEKNITNYLSGNDKNKAINLLGTNKQNTLSQRAASISQLENKDVISQEQYLKNLDRIEELQRKIQAIEEKRVELENLLVEKAEILRNNNNLETSLKRVKRESEKVPDNGGYGTVSDIRKNKTTALQGLKNALEISGVEESEIKKLTNGIKKDNYQSFNKVWLSISNEMKQMLPEQIRDTFETVFKTIKSLGSRAEKEKTYKPSTESDEDYGESVYSAAFGHYEQERVKQYKERKDSEARELEKQLGKNKKRESEISDRLASENVSTKRDIQNKTRQNTSSVKSEINQLEKENRVYEETKSELEKLHKEFADLQELSNQANVNKLKEIKNILQQFGIDTSEIQSINQAKEALENLINIVNNSQTNVATIQQTIREAGQGALANPDDYSLESTTEERDLARIQLEEVERERREALNKQSAENLNSISEAYRDVSTSAEQANNKQEQSSKNIAGILERQEKLNKSLEAFKEKIKYFVSFSGVLYGVRNAITQTYQDVVELDEAMASIAMVSDYSVEDMWGFYDQYADMAQKMGQNTKDVIQSSALYVQQGLSLEESMNLTESTLRLATLAQESFTESTKYLTSALRGFKLEMSDADRVVDVYSELAAKAAADVSDIANAMSRTASIAQSAGMSLENTAALLTQTVETTQESAENIG